jgi:hypothetical protein
VFPAQVIGSRSGDDGRLRRRLLISARVAAAAAGVVLAAGFLAVPSAGPAVSVDAAPSPAPSPPADLSPAGTTTSPVVWQLRGARGGANNAVLAGYRDYVGTAVRLGEEPDPADAALPEVALDPELGRLRRALSVSSDGQVSRRGRVVVVAWVLSVRGSRAIVVGCTNSAAQHWYDGAQRRPAWRGGVVASAALLVRRADRWRVYQLNPMSASNCRR